MQIKTRKQALLDGDTTYFSGKPCPKGHIAARRTKKADCVECSRIYIRKYLEDPEKRERERKRAYKRWIENKEEYNKRRRLWDKNNPEKASAQCKVRNKRVRQATPKWITREQIKQMKEMYIISSEQPDKYHVDHIIPLKGKNVCGLHVPWNLRIVSAKVNLTKGNKTED